MLFPRPYTEPTLLISHSLRVCSLSTAKPTQNTSHMPMHENLPLISQNSNKIPFYQRQPQRRWYAISVTILKAMLLNLGFSLMKEYASMNCAQLRKQDALLVHCCKMGFCLLNLCSTSSVCVHVGPSRLVENRDWVRGSLSSYGSIRRLEAVAQSFIGLMVRSKLS